MRKSLKPLKIKAFQAFFEWQREKDSNPHKQSQSLSCYPYTIPLCLPLPKGQKRL